MSMTKKQALDALEALGSERMREQNAKRGAGDNQYGVRRGDVRALAKKIKTNHPLALELWDTGNIDARFLSVLLMKPAELSAQELDKMVRSVDFQDLADWHNNYIVKNHADKEALRLKWLEDSHPMASRAGWSLTSRRISHEPEGLDIPAILDRLEIEMPAADPNPQWTMNNSLVEIGIHFPEHRKRALAIGEKLGIYRDWPVPKGCTSPFAPIWINEIVSRQEAAG